nr:pre-mRNA-splicing factor cwc22-like [Manis javanica]
MGLWKQQATPGACWPPIWSLTGTEERKRGRRWRTTAPDNRFLETGEISRSGPKANRCALAGSRSNPKMAESSRGLPSPRHSHPEVTGNSSRRRGLRGPDPPARRPRRAGHPRVGRELRRRHSSAARTPGPRTGSVRSG